jgi:hypothetical protein
MFLFAVNCAMLLFDCLLQLYQFQNLKDINFLVWVMLVGLCIVQGEELKRVIGAASYIECSSKTQQVCLMPILQCFKLSCRVCYATMCQV